MPTRPAGYCSGRGRRCPRRATDRGLCDECRLERERTYDQARPNSSERGYDAEWQAFRAEFLLDHPQCECPKCSKLPIWQRPEAVDVDHVDGLGPRGPRGFDPSNCRALTHGHHSERTAADQPGGWNRRRGRSPRGGGG